jgi:hypothetical protein
MRIKKNQIDLEITTITNGSSTKRFQTGATKNTKRYTLTAPKKMEDWFLNVK